MPPPTGPAGNGRQPQPAPDDSEPLCSPADVAQMLGGGNLTARTVVRRWRSWGLTAYRIGRELRFTRSDVQAMITARQIPPQPHSNGTKADDAACTAPPRRT